MGERLEWTDEGIVLHVRPHGESSAIVELLTRAHGRHLGLVRGGRGKRMRAVLQPGNGVRATWRARLAEHLGTYTLEPVTERTGLVLADRFALAGLTAAAAVAAAALPEREAHPRIHAGLEVVLDALGDPDAWPALLVRWELGFLADLGFGLDLAACALTGGREGLAYVSPRSGRAVTAEAAGGYRDRLLRLPAYLAGGNGSEVPPPAPGPGDIADGLALTGHFLEKRVFAPQGLALPEPRLRLMELVAARARGAGPGP